MNVVGHHMQRYAVWFGGSVLSSTPDFYKVPISSVAAPPFEFVSYTVLVKRDESGCFA